MWTLNPLELTRLKGAGDQFAHFIDRLIRAEAAAGGLIQSAIATQVRVHIRDGGIDTEVRQPIPQDKTGWFCVPTCWQFKALDAKDIDDRDKSKNKKKKTNDLQDAIRSFYCKELIQQGYGYRLCLLGDLPPQKLAKWEALLKAEALAINPQAPEPRIIHGGHLPHWAERFPAVVAWLRNWTQGVLHWESWAANRRALTPHYVPNPAWDSVRTAVLDHAQFDRPSFDSDACLPVKGAAGVGKTRLVFETLESLQQAPALVIVAEDEQEAKRVAVTLANASDLTAILVADECTTQTRHFLSQTLKAHRHRVRVICIDNTPEPLAAAPPPIWLAAEALTLTPEILEKNFPLVPQDRRSLYCKLSGNFVRLAADMCDRDSQLIAGDMSRLLNSVEEYGKERLRRLGNEVLAMIALLSLFHKVGFKDDVAEELDALCQLIKQDRHQFQKVVRAVKDAPGFVVQAGRYWYITPEIVARVLFAEGWDRWVASNPAAFLTQLPPHLLHQLLQRVATHATPEVRDQIGSFFRAWFSQLRAHDLADSATTSIVSALVETSPVEFLPRLRTVIETANPGELQAISGYPLAARWGPRRTLVWLLERLVSFPEFFDDCEACLFRLALEESEKDIGNNATAIWTNLYSVSLSGTAKPFADRLPILQRRTSAGQLSEARLGFAALAKALERPVGHLIGNAIAAGRLRPIDWQPATRAEENECYRSALAICEHHLKTGLAESHRLAFLALAGGLHRLLYHGLANEVFRIATPEILTEHELRKVRQIVDEFLDREEALGRADVNERATAYIQSIRDWNYQSQPRDFPGQLRSVFARLPWDRRFRHIDSNQQDETVTLAGMIV